MAPRQLPSRRLRFSNNGAPVIIYLAGPMSGVKDFNFPAFDEATAKLRAEGHCVFSPAEKDRAVFGQDINKSETGDVDEASAKGFSLRRALYEDTKFICLEADTIAMLPGWEHSKGARAERALAYALGHKIIYL